MPVASRIEVVTDATYASQINGSGIGVDGCAGILPSALYG